MSVTGKVVVVTGGASGIGGAVSRLLVERGARVVAVDMDVEAGRRLTADLGDAVAVVTGDVAQPTLAEQAVRQAVESFGRLDGLVNNAHASRQALLTDLTDDDWALAFDSGVRATRQFMLAAHPHLRERGGAVVNFASGAGIRGMPTQGAYGSAKEAIRGLSRVAAHEWARDDIRVNVIGPLALTDGVRRWSEQAPQQYEGVRAQVPLGRFGDPATDVAPVVAFLVSDDARYLTGQTIMADGGSVMPT